MAKPSSYWDKRAIRRLTDAERQGEEYSKRIRKIYDQAYKNIQRDIEDIYRNYSKATGLDVQSLKTLLTKSETDKLWKELKAKGLDKYIKENYKARISRLEKIQAQIYAKAKEIYPKEQLEHTMCYEGVINSSYYKTIYDTQMGTGLDFTFSKIDENMVSSLLTERWSGKNYSECIWGNTDTLGDDIAEIIGGAMLSGQSVAKTSRQIRDRFGVAKYYADRLVRTEVNHFNNEADAMAYEEMDVDKYVFLATLDTRTSTKCQEMDGEVIDLKDKQVGVNFPPLHPNCRSKTRAYMGEEIEKTLKRRARNPITGKTEIIDNISYKDWYDKQVKKYGKNAVDNTYKMVKNKANDQKQYEKYKGVIGSKNLPDTLEKWQDLKYNNIEEYNLTKYNYKLRNEVKHNPENVVKSMTVAPEKYTKYLFDGNNEDGLVKGRLITDILGYDKTNYGEFDKLLKDNINSFPKRYKDTSKYGERYEVNMVLKGKKDRLAKVTVGLIKSGDEYKLTSAYIDELKRSDLTYEKKRRA